MKRQLHIFYGLKNNDNKISQGIVDNYNKFIELNNDFTLEKWNHIRSLEFVTYYFPNYLDTYKTIRDYRYKCDLVRLMVLYIRGGFYMDIDCECLCSLNKMNINNDTELCIVFNSSKNEIFNSLIYVKNTENEFIKNCIDAYANLIKKKNIGACPIMKTVFDNMYPNYDLGITNNIVVHQERPEKQFKDCKTKEEFWKSFYIYNSKNEKIMKSRYDNYYIDRNNNNNLVIFN